MGRARRKHSALATYRNRASTSVGQHGIRVAGTQVIEDEADDEEGDVGDNEGPGQGSDEEEEYVTN